MRRIKYKAFTIIELLVVLAIIGIFSAIAYPNVSSWIVGREVKKEVYTFVAEINEMKSKVLNGQYAMAMLNWSHPSSEYATLKKYYMTNEDYFTHYKGKKLGSSCNKNPGNQKYQHVGDFSSQEIRHWPNIHLCISKDGSKKGDLNGKNPVTGKRKTLGRVILCSISNTTISGSDRCNESNKIDHRYLITWNRFADIKIYTYNKKKGKWCEGTNCYSYSGDFRF